MTLSEYIFNDVNVQQLALQTLEHACEAALYADYSNQDTEKTVIELISAVRRLYTENA